MLLSGTDRSVDQDTYAHPSSDSLAGYAYRNSSVILVGDVLTVSALAPPTAKGRRAPLLAALLAGVVAMLVVFQPGAAPVSAGAMSGNAGLIGATPEQAKGDYDADHDGLLEIRHPVQLNAVPWDLDGDGVSETILEAPGYADAFTRNPEEDFNDLPHTSAEGIWSNGVTMWVADNNDDKLYAYDIATKGRVRDKDFDTLKAAGNVYLEGIWSDGATMWVADDGAKLYAYDVPTKAHVPGEDFNTLSAAGNNGPKGIWSDGTTMWVREDADRKIYAYRMPPPSAPYATPSLSVPQLLWSDAHTGKIQMAKLDGSDVRDLVTPADGLVHPAGIVLDVSARKMYWIDWGSDKIQRANLDGSGIEDLVTTGLDTPDTLALDLQAGKMYWTDAGTDKIQRANLDGSDVEDRVTSGLMRPDGLALDPSAGKMYWTDHETSKIQRGNLDGSAVEYLVTSAQGLIKPDTLGLDVSAGKMYWTDHGTDKIQRANLDGSEVEDLVISGLVIPDYITLDVSAGKMYWTDHGTDKIQRSNLDGSSVEDVVTAGLLQPSGVAIMPAPSAPSLTSATRPLSEWTLMGDAERNDSGSVVLTPAEPAQIGFMFHPYPINSQQFDIAFSFEIGDGTGADGLALVVTPDFPNAADVTSRRWYGGHLGSLYFKGAVAVAFDTWQNSGLDSSDNHVELDLMDGALPETLAAADLPQRLEDSGVFDAEVAFDHGRVEVHLSNLHLGMERTLVLSHTIPDFVPFEAHVGFLATTGGATNRHVIHRADLRVPVSSGGHEDYDADGDGLIEVSNLEQLNAIRWNVDGDGMVENAGYAQAFPDAAADMGCPDAGCSGYELITDLDFDTNGNGQADPADAYWNDGAGWEPIGSGSHQFNTTFDGGGRTISNLYINRPSTDGIGLFGATGASTVIQRLGLVNANIGGNSKVGALIGSNEGGNIRNNYVTGSITGRGVSNAFGYDSGATGGLVGLNKGTITASWTATTVLADKEGGGLVGSNFRGTVTRSYATGGVTVADRNAGGLVGEQSFGTITDSYSTGSVISNNTAGGAGGLVGGNYGSGSSIANSYSTGTVTGDRHVGGLVGYNGSGVSAILGTFSGAGAVTASYWDTETSGLPYSAAGIGKTTAELQEPTGYTGIYAGWNVDIDNADGDADHTTGGDNPWDFGTSSQYPMLRNVGPSSPSPKTPTVLLAAPQLFWVDEEAQKVQRTGTGDDPDVTELPTPKQGLDTPGSIAVDLAGGKVYWTDDGASTSRADGAIWRANLDGSAVEMIKGGLKDPVGIVLDLDAGYVYWADRYQGAIYRSAEKINQDRMQVTAITLVDGLNKPYQIALDTAQGHMYWTERGEDTSKIRRAALNGDDVTDLNDFGWVTPQNPFGLALDPAAGRMYWTERRDEGDVVAGADLDGQNRQILVRSTPYSLSGITLDPANGKIYWTDETTGSIWRADPAADSVSDTVEEMVTGLKAPEGLAIARSPDAGALRALYEAIDGDDWRNNDGWLSDAPIGEWHGVTADDNGRVVSLKLIDNRLRGVLPPELGNLSNLKTLNLSQNRLMGSIPFQLSSFDDLAGCETLWPGGPGQDVLDILKDYTGRLNDLEELDLSENRLSGVISRTLCSLANLQSLDLGGNQLSGALPGDLGDLENLQSLDLGGNQLSGTIPEDLGQLENLEALILGNNNLAGPVPADLARLPNLETLTLRGNRLDGEIPDLRALSDTLRWLNLEYNELDGEIPAWLGDFIELRGLGLGHNRLRGTIPAELGKLTNLRVLYLDDQDYFRGREEEAYTPDGDKIFESDWSYLHGEIPPQLGNLGNLEVLNLSQNRLTGQIPHQLGDLSNLRVLYLYDNDLSESIPRQLGQLSNLEMLNLSQNQLTGTITASLGDVTNLRGLYLYDNDLSGSIPFQLGKLSELEALTVSRNQLTGGIPAELGDLTKLTRLYLYGNELSGSIPRQLGNLTNLEMLSLSQNQLTGEVPAELGNLINLTKLYLYKNNDLSGLIPESVTGLPNLIVLNIEDTQLSVVPPQNVAGIQQDREALVALYDAAGARWTNKDKWGSDEPISEWQGVTVAAESDPNRPGRTGRVIKLDLQDKMSQEDIYNWIATIPDNAGDPSASLFWLESLELHIVTEASDGDVDDLIKRLTFISPQSKVTVDATTYSETGNGAFIQAGKFTVEAINVASPAVKAPIAGYTSGARIIRLVGGGTGRVAEFVLKVADSPAGKLGSKLNLAGTIITSSLDTELINCVGVEFILHTGIVERGVGQTIDYKKCRSAIDNFLTDAISSLAFGINFWESGADILTQVARWIWE